MDVDGGWGMWSVGSALQQQMHKADLSLSLSPYLHTHIYIYIYVCVCVLLA